MHDFEENIFFKSMILKKSFSKNRDFESKFFRLVIILIKVFITCQILNQLFKHASDFDLNIIKHVRFSV